MTRAVSPGLPAGVLEPDDRGHLVGQPDQQRRVDLAAGAARDVVERRSAGRWRRPTARKCASRPGLRRAVVVRRDHEQAVDAGGGGALAELAGVAGVVGAGAGDERHVDRGAHGRPELHLLVVGQRGRLAGGAGQHEAVVAVVDEPAGQRDRAVDVERAVVVERRDHRREHSTEPAFAISPRPRRRARCRACTRRSSCISNHTVW